MGNLNPSSASNRPVDLHASDYTNLDKSTPGVSRSDIEREMLVGILDKGMLSHSTILLAYFARVSSGVTMRLYFIELFVEDNTGKNVLSISGPAVKLRPEYKCKEFHLVRTSMTNVKDIARDTIRDHGSYSRVFNNCKHFTEAYFKKLSESTSTVRVKISWKDIIAYIQEHPPCSNPSAFGGPNTMTFLEFLDLRRMPKKHQPQLQLEEVDDDGYEDIDLSGFSCCSKS